MEGIMLEDFKDGHDDLRILAQNSQCLFSAAVKDTRGSRHSHAVDDVPAHTKGYQFREG